jgi:hypothetical protein
MQKQLKQTFLQRPPFIARHHAATTNRIFAIMPWRDLDVCRDEAQSMAQTGYWSAKNGDRSDRACIARCTKNVGHRSFFSKKPGTSTREKPAQSQWFCLSLKLRNQSKIVSFQFFLDFRGLPT